MRRGDGEGNTELGEGWSGVMGLARGQPCTFVLYILTHYIKRLRCTAVYLLVHVDVQCNFNKQYITDLVDEVL